MDRDAGSTRPPVSPADAVPPTAPESVRTTGVVGVALVAAAAALGVVVAGIGNDAPTVLNAARLFLVFAGVVVAGAAVSMRPDLWWAWAFGATACVLAWAGLPSHWDSFRLLVLALAGVAAAGGALTACAPKWRPIVASAVILFHFGGIFMAATSPPATPWLTEQAFQRVYNPYLQFIYMRNAYHFYSPDPGPASLLAFLIKTETTDPASGEKRYTTEWVVMPKRPGDVHDPLGLTYYRRLSLTEQLARGSPGLALPTDALEKDEISNRRAARRDVYPYHPVEAVTLQYKMPSPDVSRYLIPSYASHVILEHVPKEAAAKTTVKVYRLEHRTLSPEEFRRMLPGGGYPSPYFPGTYRPFFLGEYDVWGNLRNPREEMLYWLIPVMPRVPSPNDPYKKEYLDYMSAHALDIPIEDVLKADEKDGRVFNWSQLK